MENLDQVIQELFVRFISFLPSIVSALVIFIGGFFAAAWINRLVRAALVRRDVELELQEVLSRLTRWSIVGIFTVTALNQVDFDLTAFLTGLGIVGFTIGFALQDVSKNFIAGLLILLQRPFELGHTIAVGSFTGTVTQINMRATEMKAIDGTYVLIPNGEVFTSPIINYTRAEERRIEIKVGVAYGSDTVLVSETALRALASVPGIKQEPAPQVVFDSFGGSSLDLTAYYWIDTAETGVFAATNDGVTRINRAFEEAGIEVPFPTQSLLLPKKVEKGLVNGMAAMPD